MTNILWLGEPRCADAQLVGGKAATLSRLAALHPVPPGFCLTTLAFERWAGAQPAGQRVTLPPALYNELAAAYALLARRCGVQEPALAVRSSAVGEDGAASSYAGQHESILHVVGIEQLAGAVLRCWASAWSERAAAYREQRGQPDRPPRMAVLVQQLVPADVAAVVFSANPLSGRRDELLINASWGLGEPLVGGLITPDSYTIRKADLALVEQQLGSKEHMSVPGPGGTLTVEVPAARRAQPALDANQLQELARLALILEGQQGQPVDLECAYHAGQLALLQCRPITTLPAAPAPAAWPEDPGWCQPDHAQLTWRWSRQAFPEPLTPLVQSYLPYHTQGWAAAGRQQGARIALRLRCINGYPYSVWHWMGDLPPGDGLAKQQERLQRLPRRWAEEWLPELQADLAWLRALDLPALPDDELAHVLSAALSRQQRHWEIHAAMGSLPLQAVQQLVDWYLERFPGAPESEPYRLVQGQLNTSVQGNHQLWELSRLLTPEGAAQLRSGAFEQLAEPLRSAFQRYLDDYGQRTHRLADPGSPTWREDPTPVARLMLAYADAEVGDPYLELERLAVEREAFTAEVRARLEPGEREQFETLLACALANNPLTEDHAHWLDQQSVAGIRLVCAEFGRRMAALGALEQPQDLAYLRLDELLLWGFGVADPLRQRVAERRAQHVANQRLSPPDWIGAEPQPVSWVDRFGGPAAPLAAPAGEIHGVGASAGIARGPARVVRSLDQALELRPGEVLVCVSTDPAWTALFGLAAALVTDAGGSLCHAAVVAREYRLPAVVGTHVGTQRISSGQVVEVDGLAGVVRLL